MKITNRSSIKRLSAQKPSYDFGSADKETFVLRRQSMPITSIAAMHYAKRQACPNIHMISDFNYAPFVNDQSTVGYASTKGVYDSRKQKTETVNKLDWKILTLKQIKQNKGQILNHQKLQESQQKGNRKIFVSISKSNRGSVSKEKRSTQPKLSEIYKDFTLLRSISNKRKIVDMVELQMEQNIRTNRFFCN